MSSEPNPQSRLILTHVAALLLALLAILFLYWFLSLNPFLPGVFKNLFYQEINGRLEPVTWQIGTGEMDWAGLIWGIAAVALFTVFGWFCLESFELYLPRTAAVALAFIFGMGIVGLVLEWLAIPYWLTPPMIAASLLALLVLLGLGALRKMIRPTESGLGGEAGFAEHELRRKLARRAHEATIERPQTLPERVFRSLAFLLIAAITFFIFWHALLYPDVYWDTLILYMGYARMTFLRHGFPVKVVGQVGIGLGANYPHLYAVLGAGIATAMGEWSELPQRLIAPLCGVATTVLVYHSALRLTRDSNGALSIALLYRSIPLGIAYDQYASDYALGMLFGAATLYLCLRAIESGLIGYLAACALLIGLSMHLNYLMGILWVPWGATVLLAHVGWRGDETGADAMAPWTGRTRFGWAIFKSSHLWIAFMVACVLGSTWLVRNWVVTGNPVYSFFYKQLGGKNINPDVMEASAEEWMVNGAGIGGFTRQIAAGSAKAFEKMPPQNWYESFFNPTKDTRLARLQLMPEFLFGSQRWRQGYQLMPMIGGFSLGGFLIWLGLWFASPFAGKYRSPQMRVAVRFGLVVALLALSLIAFHILLAPFYLYQIIKLLPCLALLAALAWPIWKLPPWRWIFASLALCIGFVPGLAMALMGFKIGGALHVPGGDVSPLSLYALRNPLPERREFLRWRYGDDVKMWDYVNLNLKNQKILTHENRHLVFDPSIAMIHLDDWDMQQLWNVPDPAERVRRLVRDFDIHYYLYVPNEDNTPTNARMGAKQWESLGLAKLAYETQDPVNKLYALTPKN